MKYSYKKAGLKLPRTSSAQARRAHRIPKKQLRRGDLMFFSDGGGVYHAAMFLKWKPRPRGDGALARERRARPPGQALDQELVRRDAAALRPTTRWPNG